MANEERDIDSMKYRKSTHIAGVDVETIVDEKGKCLVTIKDAYYAKNIDVSGNNTDGYFIEFVEPLKPMVVNSGNRKIIGNNLKIISNCSGTDSRNLKNWIGLTIELWFDPAVKMMGKVTGGIKVKPQNPIKELDTKPAIEKLKACKTLEEMKPVWEKLSKDERENAFIIKTKEELKLKLN